MDTCPPMEAGELLREQRMRALSSLLFLKEKHTGDIKGRVCINGAPQRGEKAALNEMTQLHIMDTWTPLEAGKLLREQRMRELSLLLFLKEKQTWDIKGRACINRGPQRTYILKEDAASSTISTESTFITAAIAVKERRKVRCYDVPSAFINTDVDKDVIMVLKGELADMMIQIAPKVYRKYVTADRKETPILYVKLQKALYGLMRASLLFYRKLRKGI